MLRLFKGHVIYKKLLATSHDAVPITPTLFLPDEKADPQNISRRVTTMFAQTGTPFSGRINGQSWLETSLKDPQRTLHAICSQCVQVNKMFFYL